MHVLDYFLVILRSESKKGEQITRFSSPLHYSMIRTRLPLKSFRTTTTENAFSTNELITT